MRFYKSVLTGNRRKTKGIKGIRNGQSHLIFRFETSWFTRSTSQNLKHWHTMNRKANVSNCVSMTLPVLQCFPSKQLEDIDPLNVPLRRGRCNRISFQNDSRAGGRCTEHWMLLYKNPGEKKVYITTSNGCVLMHWHLWMKNVPRTHGWICNDEVSMRCKICTFSSKVKSGVTAVLLVVLEFKKNHSIEENQYNQ